MANFEPLPFRRKFATDPAADISPESTSARIEGSPFVDVSGVTMMRTAVTGACRKCGYAGHLAFQCRNFIQPKDSKETFLDISSTSSESDYETPLTSKEEKKKKKKKKEYKKRKKEKKRKSKTREHKHKRKRKHSSSSGSECEKKKKK
uniref:Protein SREK1IP1 n=1 Tax=Parascaris univalens TaxID=6257 RepID=A0A915BEA2_PARUN